MGSTDALSRKLADSRPHGLNIGCGDKPQLDAPDLIWINLDMSPHPEVDVVRDIRRGLPFNDDMFDVILLDNVLEHFVSDDVIFLLNEIFRVARPGATVHIIVPHAFSQGAHQDPTHKSYYVPRNALYWNQHDTPYGGIRLGISANLRTRTIKVIGDMATEAFIHFELIADKG
jgi:SAM-dependent methyltransferase